MAAPNTKTEAQDSPQAALAPTASVSTEELTKVIAFKRSAEAAYLAAHKDIAKYRIEEVEMAGRYLTLAIALKDATSTLAEAVDQLKSVHNRLRVEVQP